MNSTNLALLKKTLLTQAFADAFGYIIEFDTLDSIISKYGKNGLTIDKIVFQNIPLYISDDTQMSLFALEGITQCFSHGEFKYNQKTISQSFLDWFQTQKNSNNSTSTSYLLKQNFLHYNRAPGRTCLEALNLLQHNINHSLFDLNNKPNQSKGCGSIMRTMPFAFFAQSDTDAWILGQNQGVITHGHNNGFNSSAFYTALSFYLINSKRNIFECYQMTKKLCSQFTNDLDPYLHKLDIYLKEFYYNNYILTPTELTAKFGEGWTADEALIIAIYSSIVSNSLLNCIYYSSNHSGDSDSTAMLAAGLYQLSHPNEQLSFDPNYFVEYNSLLTSIDYLIFQIQ